MNYWKKWAKAAGIRALKTVAEVVIGMIGTKVLVEQVEWHAVLSAAILAGIVSLCISLAGLPELKDNTVKEENNNDGENV